MTTTEPTDHAPAARDDTGSSAAGAFGQYCPISRALEVLGTRWSLLIVRDMICGTTRFNDLARGLPGLSRTLLAQRLRQLERAGIIDHVRAEYVLTTAGRDLEPLVFALGAWGARWAFEDPRPDELDPELLVWWMHGRVDTTRFPGLRHVLRVEFTDDRRVYWIVIERGSASVCPSDPGYAVNLTIRASVSDLYRVWLGRLGMMAAVRQGLVSLTGERAWTRSAHEILQLSPAAPPVMAANEP
ncbi:MAG: winged helix-turn-helix transcriptional regulator [Tetrasphaera sp.]